jgi:hypothetical protein
MGPPAVLILIYFLVFCDVCRMRKIWLVVAFRQAYVHNQYAISFISDIYRAGRTMRKSASIDKLEMSLQLLQLPSSLGFTNGKNNLIFPLLRKYNVIQKDGPNFVRTDVRNWVHLFKSRCN